MIIHLLKSKKRKSDSFSKRTKSQKASAINPEQKAKAETFAKQGNRRDMKMNNRKFNHSSGREQVSEETIVKKDIIT